VDLIEGYNPNRKLKIYANGGVGLGVDRSGTMVQRFGKVYYEALGGLGVSYKMNKVTFRIEDNIHLPGDFGNGFQFDKGYFNCLSVGVYYNFGITEVDKIRLAQMEDILAKGEAYDGAMYDCTSTINAYQDSIDKCKIGLIAAVFYIDSLQQTVEVLQKNTEEFEKLRAQIDQMREEQYTYWALPVSIQFDFDSYTVNVSEQYKVQALADVMKTTEYNYIVVGFADSIGSVEYNNELSMRRAEAVKDELVQRGVNESCIEVRAVGMDSPFGTIHKTNRKVSVYRVID
jgi:outer membrane protein OmpA-like peptidoglycan-associated protein